MNTVTTTYDRLQAVLIDLGVEGQDITPDAALRADLDIDSAELVEIVTRLAPGKVDGNALKAVRTIADLVTFLAQLA
jgi:phosphopantetheine binding protein